MVVRVAVCWWTNGAIRPDVSGEEFIAISFNFICQIANLFVVHYWPCLLSLFRLELPSCGRYWWSSVQYVNYLLWYFISPNLVRIAYVFLFASILFFLMNNEFFPPYVFLGVRQNCSGCFFSTCKLSCLLQQVRLILYIACSTSATIHTSSYSSFNGNKCYSLNGDLQLLKMLLVGNHYLRTLLENQFIREPVNHYWSEGMFDFESTP